MIDGDGYRLNVGIVICNNHGQVFWAKRYGQHSWQFPQGGIDEGETPEQAAVREIKEEMSLDIKIVEKLGDDEYVASHPQKGKVRKQVVFFLGESDFVPCKLESTSGGLDDCKWFTLKEVTTLRMYDSVTALIAKAIPIITNKK